MIELLSCASAAKTLPATIQLGPRLSLSTVWLDASQGPLRGVIALIVSALGLAMIEAIGLHALYRWAIHYALNTEIGLRRSLYEKGMALAFQHGAIGQQEARNEATTHWIPMIRDGLVAWHRTVPRHLIQAMACFVFAILIHPKLMFLAAIAFVLLWRLYGLMDGHRRRMRPILTERIHAAKSQLTTMDECGPLVSSVHPEKLVRELFESSLRQLRDAEFKLYDCTLWKAPFLLATVALLVSLFGFSLSVQILQENASIGVAGALTMLVLIGFGSVSILKVKRAWAPIRIANNAAERLMNLLSQSPPVANNSSAIIAVPLKQRFSLENISFKDTLGKTLISDVSIEARPGMLVALVATSRLDAQAVGEIILGFGKPLSGRILWDGIDTQEIAIDSIQKHCCSVASDGPMISGTLIENLSNGNPHRPLSDLIEAVKQAGAFDAIDQLQDSFSTLISPNDDRLKNDSLYQLGIARAILRQPSVVVAQEPVERVSGVTESQSVAALRYLTNQGSLVFVIPQRLSALRQADLVVLIHDHRVAGIGTHLDLLNKSELYRHVNYVRFSNLKDVLIS